MSEHIALRGVAGPERVAARPGRVSDLLDQVQPIDGATHGTVVAGDGYRASVPLDVLRTGGVFALEDGGVRLTVVDGDTLCWNVKDVTAIEFTIGRAPDDVPENPPH